METIHTQVTSLYKLYNEVINPLIAEIEARENVFPISLLNEIRSFTTHISRCYVSRQIDTKKEIKSAESHINRAILDCYKYLIIALNDFCVKDFERNTKNVDLSALDNGTFKANYQILKEKAVEALYIAKIADMKNGNKEETVLLYRDALSHYREFEIFIKESSLKIKWAEKRTLKKRIYTLLIWLVGAIVSGLISSQIVPYDMFITWLRSFF